MQTHLCGEQVLSDLGRQQFKPKKILLKPKDIHSKQRSNKHINIST